MYIDSLTNKPINHVFEIDDEMYPILEILWNKGYVTNSSCAGHNKIKYLESLCADPVDNEFVFDSPVIVIYLGFPGIIQFDDIPRGFDLKYKEMIHKKEGLYTKQVDTMIKKIISIYKPNDALFDILKNSEELEEELINSRIEIINWANKLPNIKENNLQRERKIKNYE